MCNRLMGKGTTEHKDANFADSKGARQARVVTHSPHTPANALRYGIFYTKDDEAYPSVISSEVEKS